MSNQILRINFEMNIIPTFQVPNIHWFLAPNIFSFATFVSPDINIVKLSNDFCHYFLAN